MTKTARSRAEIMLAATRVPEKQAVDEQEEARRARAENMARLRALRLAKEAADKKAAEETAAT